MTNDSQAPVTRRDLVILAQTMKADMTMFAVTTKADIANLKDYTTKILEANKRDTTALMDMLMETMGKLYDANARWKDEILETMRSEHGKLKRELKHELKTELLHEFKIMEEAWRHDVLGVYRDEIKGIDGRLKRDEVHLSLAT
jgi:hypothetical protein